MRWLLKKRKASLKLPLVSLSILLTSWPLPSQASPTTEQEKEPPVISLQEGEEAPFNGLLLTPKRAAKLHSRIEFCEKALKLSEENFKDSLLLEQAAHKNKVALLEEALAKAEKDAERAWYENPELWFTTGTVAGVIVGTAASIGLLWLAAQVRIEVPVGEN